MTLTRALFALFFFSAAFASGQEIRLQLVEAQTEASFRGLSVVDNETAWVSGSKGYVGVTRDGGSNWKFLQVPGFEALDFRSIYAFDDRKAIIANAGAPANILITTDGGLIWKTVYTNSDTAAFIDGVDFWNEMEGLVYGDPIKGKMLLIKTSDGGFTWNELSLEERPILNEGEASFAASGTNIRCSGTREVFIATGGKVSRLWYSADKGSSWRSIAAPVIQGESATGIFSLARKGNKIIIVGGNYLQDTLRVKHVFFSDNKGLTWNAPAKPTRGYRESVEYISGNLVATAGPGGIDLSRDGGKTWEAFSDEKYFHVLRKARKGSLVLVAGGKGKIGVMKVD
jgi:photosystem II stability/assembly factor-like uncharacterized protein